jgi:hypothetical protein
MPSKHRVACCKALAERLGAIGPKETSWVFVQSFSVVQVAVIIRSVDPLRLMRISLFELGIALGLGRALISSLDASKAVGEALAAPAVPLRRKSELFGLSQGQL